LHEIESLRIALECFAFEQVWPRRDAEFEREMRSRQAALTGAIERGEDDASIAARPP